MNRAGLANDLGEKNSDYSDGRFYSMKRLDLLSTIVLKNALQFTGKCECVAPGPKVDTESPAGESGNKEQIFYHKTSVMRAFDTCLLDRWIPMNCAEK